MAETIVAHDIPSNTVTIYFTDVAIELPRDVAASLGGKLLALEAELEKADANNNPA